MTGATKYGQHVHRTTGVWTPTVHRLLTHLASSGIGWVPTPTGFDERGREILTFLRGTVPHDPMPEWVWTDVVLLDAARHLTELHDATAGYHDPEGSWRLPAHEPQEVICHNDFVPYNMVFDAHRRLVGVIDWDTASPGPRVWDLAYLAYRVVPLSAPGNPDGIESSIVERRRRRKLLCHAYARGETPERVVTTAIQRLYDLADFTARRAAEGATHLAAHVELYRDAADWLSRYAQLLAGTTN
jgi:aminoglycoside phosphotransferase (APT) family kinase protein